MIKLKASKPGCSVSVLCAMMTSIAVGQTSPVSVSNILAQTGTTTEPMSSCNSVSCSFTALVDFIGPNGYVPQASLVQGIDGNLYGTTTEGGNGFGTVFKMTATGILTTLYSFRTRVNCSDGASPYGNLTLGTDENFYGTAASGGEGQPNPCYFGNGTIFKITPTGALTTLHIFRGTDGSFPRAGLIQASDGDFYGTTTLGAQ
jgi:uncharacterized repeat protein (TIGR03803 family)